MKKTITKEFEFCYAHRLVNKELTDEENRKIYGKCFEDIHGHNAKLFIKVASQERNGMIINFNDLKIIVNNYILELFDHHFLNNLKIMNNKTTTCENMIDVIWDILEKKLKEVDVVLEGVKLYETPTSYCELERDD